jgi:DNA-binding cell septation regulator SpoVG
MKVLNMRASGSSSKIRGYFDVETADGMTVKGFKIAEGPTGLFVGMPSEKDKNGKWWDRVLMPKEMKDELTHLAMQEYDKLEGSGPASAPGAPPPGDKDLPF